MQIRLNTMEIIIFELKKKPFNFFVATISTCA